VNRPELAVRLRNAIAKPIAERSHGNVGHISIDTHWDSQPIESAPPMDPRIAGSGSWKAKMYEFHKNLRPRTWWRSANAACSSERKRSCAASSERAPTSNGMWKIRRELGIGGCARSSIHAYDGTGGRLRALRHGVLGGAGPRRATSSVSSPTHRHGRITRYPARGSRSASAACPVSPSSASRPAPRDLTEDRASDCDHVHARPGGVPSRVTSRRSRAGCR